MSISSFLKKSTIFFFLGLATFSSTAQTQNDFDKKLEEISSATGDQKKILAIAKEMYNIIEKKKELQTYSNYYLLKNIFEIQAPDTALAKSCLEKADTIMKALVGVNNADTTGSLDPGMQWFQVYYPSLFTTTDPNNAVKAVQFLEKNPSLKNFGNYIYVGYAFERNADFKKAKQYYELGISLAGNDKDEYHSYGYYTNFLSRSGDYLKAEEFIQKMERLSEEANEWFRMGYKSESISSKAIYYFAIGDYQSYSQSMGQQYDYLSATIGGKDLCNPYPAIRFFNTAFAKEMMKDYDGAEKFWKSRDSADNIWIGCTNKTYPNFKQYPLSVYPVFLLKRGKKTLLPQPAFYYIKEAETHFNNYLQYADIGINFLKGVNFGFLGSPQYPAILKPVMEQIKVSRNFRESTEPFSYYAWFSMRDKNYNESFNTYQELYHLNKDWINDIVFTFGEKAFVTYYNSKLKDGYENFHSFVKLAKEKQPALFPSLSEQAYNNLLFTKSISLKGTEKRKEAFLKSNNQNIIKLYNQWIDKKQQLIRQYMKTDEPSAIDTTNKINREQLKLLQEEVNRLENQLTIQSKDFKKYLKIVPGEWKAIRDQLKEGEAAIEMIRFQWRDQVYYSDTAYYAAYIITKNSKYPEVVYLSGKASDLDNKYYKEYKNNIKLKLNDTNSYNHYWKPIQENLNGIKKIYFSPDGIYHLINIATLKNPETGQFLLDETEIHYTTSSVDIIEEISASKEIKTAVLIGRPTFKTGENNAVPLANTTTRSLVYNFRDNNIPDLPGTEAEVLAIKATMDQNKIDAKYFLKEQATEDKMYQLHSPDILHIATHGYWSPAGENATDGYRVFNAMVNSGLLLAGVVNYYSNTSYPNTYDGILTAYEAQNMDLENTSLVILSACETSLGYLDAGEGVYGLQRAFRTAGAGSIMTSLWKVEDNATKDFMISFYQQYLKTKDKSAAFILAQKAIKEKYIHPYYWGAFVMMGK